MSKTTMNDYLRSFAPDQHSACWVDDLAYLALASEEVRELLRARCREIDLRALTRKDDPAAS